jgi:(1->4)-alpha-D-glucan 1-alpha-D-glucosylmutase
MSRIPVATYRLQLHKGFDFDAAAAIANYLKALGISHVYCSPYLRAVPGSVHGYDVVDHHHVNDELGGAEGHERFSARLGECELGQVLDIVPNHMAIAGRHNAYWWDVLENGPASRYASYFDINWQPAEQKLKNKVLVPILADHYGRVLARHELKVSRREGDFLIEYFDNILPAAPRSIPSILANAAARINSDYLAFLADSLAALPRPTVTDRAALLARHRDKEVIRALFARFCRESSHAVAAIEAELEILNQNVDALDDFLERQNFRLAFWKTAGDELMYRRFFDVNTLVGLRMESDHVFADTHSLILDWLNNGVLDGVRIDHPDGLRDPRSYFQKLRDAAQGSWIVVEKIIEPVEPFRGEWPVDGTTGYDFLYYAGGLFIDPEGLRCLNQFYVEFTGEAIEFAHLCRQTKHQVMREILASDVNRLTALFVEICEGHRDHRDYTRTEIRRAIRELVACFPVYRTYIVADTGEINDLDVRYLTEATDHAKAGRGDIDPELFDFLKDVLLLKYRGASEDEFVMRFQQFTGPAMAKGVEDTAFYCFNRLSSANEVGGNPGQPVVTPSEFHQYCAEIYAQRPRTMQTTSTHDTKRSEDVRARLHLLSEIPNRWADAVKRWAAWNEQFRTVQNPDRNTEYLLYQSMVGAWPIEIERMARYMEKATREAKQRTSWINPNDEFDRALQHFIEGIYGHRQFIADLEAFAQELITPGRVSALAQILLKLTAPGIPDIYQGMELWNLSLVDPDNRRPVEYDVRRQLLSEVASVGVDEVMKRSDEGLPKLWVTYHALRIRNAYPESLGERGEYVEIEPKGRKSPHIVAFRRCRSMVIWGIRRSRFQAANGKTS